MRRLAVVVCAALAAPPLGAQGSGVPEPLARRVAAVVAERWDAPAADIHLEWSRLPDRALGAEASFRLIGHGNDGWFAVLVDRPDAAAFAVRVRAGVFATVPTAARDLDAGTVLVPADIAFETSIEWGPPDSLLTLGTVGAVTRRRLSAGEHLRAPAVALPMVVSSGDRVRVTFRSGSVTVVAPGIAAGNGLLGAMVPVRLDGPRRQVRGVVTGPGAVRIRE